MTRFHPLSTTLPAPRRMNNPFQYHPDPLCLLAAQAMQQHLPPHPREGKMLGVLIVERDGQLGYLQAYSGQTDWPLNEADFVPPVADYLQPGGHFKRHEAEIEAINHRISALEANPELLLLRRQREQLTREAEESIARQRTIMAEAKARRHQRRNDPSLTEEERQLMVRESQHQKAEMHRLKRRFHDEMAKINDSIAQIAQAIDALKAERKRRSDTLQAWLFEQFNMMNARGERKTLPAIFEEWNATHLSATARKKYGGCPSGAGECCEPKLLQYAYLTGMRPRSMAMFWWGPSPKEEVHHHGHFYPACNLRCRPVLGWMLQGLDVEEESGAATCAPTLRILYEDDSLAVVEKPSGMLSVPGKDDAPSVQSVLQARWEHSGGAFIAHRLDRDTSGLLVVARTPEAQAELQRQFAERTVHKEYVALCQAMEEAQEGQSGTISLPLSPDYLDRPRQRVDQEHGKPAETRYEVLQTLTLDNGQRAMLLRLTPLTGRTHQLRVHCAHANGLHAPIIGDPLYGQPARRLCLHAARLEFEHPLLRRRMRFHSDPPAFP